MKFTILLPMTIITSMMLMAFSLSPKTHYQMKSIESPFPQSIKDLSPEEKQEAFNQMITTGDCEYKGIKLKGKVKFVTSFPDVKIQYVTSFPDIKVKHVTSFPDDCGEWQIVTSFPDFEVQVVTSFPDIKVQKVTSFPGMN
jgi:hypothetical protein